MIGDERRMMLWTDRRIIFLNFYETIAQILSQLIWKCSCSFVVDRDQTILNLTVFHQSGKKEINLFSRFNRRIRSCRVFFSPEFVEIVARCEFMQVAGSCCSWWLEIAFVVKPNRISRLPRYLELFWTPRTTPTRERTRRDRLKPVLRKPRPIISVYRAQSSRSFIVFTDCWRRSRR